MLLQDIVIIFPVQEQAIAKEDYFLQTFRRPRGGEVLSDIAERAVLISKSEPAP